MWGSTFPIWQMAGVRLQVNGSWIVIAGLVYWMLFQKYFPTFFPDASSTSQHFGSLIGTLGLFTSLVLHEMAHAFVARHEGLPVDTITLFLFGGVAEMPAEPPTPRAELRIAIAGPIVSLMLACLFWTAAGVAGSAGLSPLVSGILGYLAIANLLIAVFNMVPAFPLDGGRVIRATFWRLSGDFDIATRRASAVSTWLCYGLIGFGLLQLFLGEPIAGLWIVAISVFVLSALHDARMGTEMRAALSGLTVQDLIRSDPIVADPSMSLETLANDLFLFHGISFAPVVEDGELIGHLSLATIRRIDRENWTATRVADVLEPLGAEDVLVDPARPAAHLVDRCQRSGRRKFIVARGRRVLGVVTMTDLFERHRLYRSLQASPS